MSKLKICVAGATGWAGSALSKGIFFSANLDLVAAISRSHAGKTLGEVIHMDGLTTPIYPSFGYPRGLDSIMEF